MDNPTKVDIPGGLRGSTSDKLKLLAALITNSVDQPYAASLTNRVLKSHVREKNKIPMPIDEPPPMPSDSDAVSLRGPAY